MDLLDYDKKTYTILQLILFYHVEMEQVVAIFLMQDKNLFTSNKDVDLQTW